MSGNSIGYKFNGAHYNGNDNDYQTDYDLSLHQEKPGLSRVFVLAKCS